VEAFVADLEPVSRASAEAAARAAFAAGDDLELARACRRGWGAPAGLDVLPAEERDRLAVRLTRDGGEAEGALLSRWNASLRDGSPLADRLGLLAEAAKIGVPAAAWPRLRETWTDFTAAFAGALSRPAELGPWLDRLAAWRGLEASAPLFELTALVWPRRGALADWERFGELQTLLGWTQSDHQEAASL
jgi:hypothetical protein